MDVVKRIDELRRERHWSEYTLAEKSGIAQSTISAWTRNNSIPSIDSLVRICNAFGITMSQFFLEPDDREVRLNQEQLRLIHYAAKLDPQQREALIVFLEAL